MENSLPQQDKKVTNGWGRKLSAFFTIILMLQIALFAIIVISEIAARESVLSMLTGRIASLKSNFVEQNRVEIKTFVEWNRAEVDSPVESTSSSESQKYKLGYQEKLLRDIEFYEGLKHSLIFLIAQGSINNPAFSLGAIQQKMLYSLGSQISMVGNVETYEQFPIFIIGAYQPFLLLSSDQLLALAVMACSAIGAMIAAMRGNGLMTLRALALGIATGFVVYLAIKGGKHVFLLQMQTEIVAFNPYGSAFAGLLAGMFTEKAYQVLTTIVDDFADRLRAVSAGRKSGD